MTQKEFNCIVAILQNSADSLTKSFVEMVNLSNKLISEKPNKMKVNSATLGSENKESK